MRFGWKGRRRRKEEMKWFDDATSEEVAILTTCMIYERDD